MTIPPVRRTISVAWQPEAAFRRFTAEIGQWWPYRSHSVGGRKVKAVVFEPAVGGKIFEEHFDGRRFLWGTVLAWEPPRMVRFTWHPSRDPETGQEVELTFKAEGTGTRLELVHRGWEGLGERGHREAKGYNIGWRYVLDVWAGKKGPFIVVLDLVAAGLTAFQRVKYIGKDPRNEAGGELPSTGVS
jgi:hypothetical protein